MIQLSKQAQCITIHIDADIINTSSQTFNLEALKLAINSQLQQVFNAQVGQYSVTLFINLTILKHINQCSPKKVLFQIVDTIAGNNAAEAVLKGLRIKLNKTYLNDIISNINTRTIPHEVGHLLGLNHPHANAKYVSINSEAHPFEQLLTEQQRQCNLMSQTWYIQKAAVLPEKAIELTEQQLDVIQEYVDNGSLNTNYHLNYFLFWKKLV